ncbi:MAG: class I tRNA ligase family protein [Patescibacteria group bacterium]|nr:class I tRNA ligase family protein [Patescibacteria group bacterium]
MEQKKFFVTTPIYYVNDKPHIGSTYTTVVADALARAYRLRGVPTLFLTGTDENSQKNLEAAEKAGAKDLTSYLEGMAETWRKTWKELGISFDDFIRTTEQRHLAAVEKFWRAVEASGDIYKAEYEREYCVGCESFKTATELVDGRCPLHPNRDLERIREENYFFRASKYKDALLKLLEDRPEFVQPKSRLNEVRSYIESAFEDFSISREAKKLSCGIPVPGDESQKIYVWFDALINYMSAVGYGTDDALFAKWWPASLHLVGKDIIKFHCALWPAMIMSAAKSDAALRNDDGTPKLPERVFAHGFFTLNGQKISKSLGNVVDPLDLAKEYPFDAVRYFLLREISFGEDGDFSFARLKERYSGELANKLGNLVNRTIAMSAKYFDGKVPEVDVARAAEISGEIWKGKVGLEKLWESVETELAKNRLDLMLEAIWNSEGASLIAADKLVEETQPFKLIKVDPEKTALVLYALLEGCRQFAWMIEPVMPNIAKSIIEQLGQDSEAERSKGLDVLKTWGGLLPGGELKAGAVLFPRLEDKKE